MTKNTPASKNTPNSATKSTGKPRGAAAQSMRVTMTSPAYRGFSIPKITRSYTFNGQQGRFSAAALEAAATRALERVALPNCEDLQGDAWDARAITLHADLFAKQAIRHSHEGNFVAAGMEQIARELTIVAGRASASSEGDIFLKLAVLSQWLGAEHLGFSTEVTAYLTEMISRDCAELAIDEDTLREKAASHFPRLRQDR